MLRRVFEIAERTLPRISRTERTALESGSASLERLAFTGGLSPKTLAKTLDKATISSCDKRYVERAETVATSDDLYRPCHVTTSKVDKTWHTLNKAGYLGLIVPKEFGGAGVSSTALSKIIQRLASASPRLAIHTMVPASLGPAELLHNYGTTEQKKTLLPMLASGAIPCFGLTSTNAGSDAAGSMTDEGIVVLKNEEIRIVLNCSKRYITLAPVADLVGIAFKIRDPEGILKSKNLAGEDGSIALAILERGRKGLVLGPYSDPLGVGFANGTVNCENVELQMNDVIGGTEGLDSGWKYLMECLAAGRGIALPASAAGSAKLLTNSVAGYASLRKQFKKPIADFEGVQEKLANMARSTYEIVSLVEMTNAVLATGIKPPVLSAIVKYRTTELARNVVNDSMDVVGGAGICMGPRNFVASHYKSAPIGITVEGSNTMTRSLLIFGQGIVRSHPYALNILKSVENGDEISFRKEITSMIKFYASLFFSSPEKQYGSYLKFFAISSSLSLALGGELKQREFLSGRYADLLTHLLGYTAMDWHNRKSEHGGYGAIVESCLENSVYSMNSVVSELINNHPHSKLHSVLAKWCGIPKVENQPSDVLSTEIVADLRNHESALRTLFSEDTLKTHPTVKAIELAIKAKGKERENLVKEIIEVDSFQ